jgi:hypothetical protein
MNSRCVRKGCDNARAVGRLCLRREHPHHPWRARPCPGAGLPWRA